MIRHTIATLLMLGLWSAPLAAQENPFKNFSQFKNVVSGVDFYAANRQLVTPFEKPIAEVSERMKTLLGDNLAKGAIFILSSLEQKDTFYEPRVLKLGYGWVITSLTAEARTQETIARMKAQSGGELPAEQIQRLQSRVKEMGSAADAGMARMAAPQMAFAILQAVFATDREFRSARIEDMARSPLPDWLDIGIASYGAGSRGNIAFLQQHLEETFSLEDVLMIARPFVAPSADGSGGGAFMVRMGGQPPDAAAGGAQPPAGAAAGQVAVQSGGGQRQGGGQGGGGGAGRGGGARALPKDQQDRLLFDTQAATFFAYLVQQAGLEKVKGLIEHCREGKDSGAYVTREDVLGPDFSKIENDWRDYVKTLKPEAPQEIRIRTNPERPGNP